MPNATTQYMKYAIETLLSKHCDQWTRRFYAQQVCYHVWDVRTQLSALTI